MLFIAKFLHDLYPLIEMIHRFGATAQFKGIHDAIGEVAKRKVRDLEKFSDASCRCSTAFEFLKACVQHLPQPLVDYSKWTDEQLCKSKDVFAADRYIWIYAAADYADGDRVAVLDPNPVGYSILVLNRELMWSSSPCTGIRSHYDFRNIRKRGAKRKAGEKNLGMRQLPCPCWKCDTESIFDDNVPCLCVQICGPVQLLCLKEWDREAADAVVGDDNEKIPAVGVAVELAIVGDDNEIIAAVDAAVEMPIVGDDNETIAVADVPDPGMIAAADTITVGDTDTLTGQVTAGRRKKKKRNGDDELLCSCGVCGLFGSQVEMRKCWICKVCYVRSVCGWNCRDCALII